MKAVLVIFVTALSTSAFASSALRCQGQEAEVKADILVWNPDGAYVFLNIQNARTGERKQFSGVDLGYMACGSSIVDNNDGLPGIQIICRTRQDQTTGVTAYFSYDTSIGSAAPPQDMLASFKGDKIPAELSGKYLQYVCKKVDADEALKDFKGDGQ